MNFGSHIILTRIFHSSVICKKTSTQAKFLAKIMGGQKKKKEHHYFIENRSTSFLPEFLEKNSGGNTKMINRRVDILNSVFLERISDLLLSAKQDHGSTSVHQNGFLVTKVKYQSDGSALHVYWQADTDYVSVEKKLPQMGGWLRHELSQLQNGRVPHINFIYDTSNYKATDVEDLLKIADFGPDHISHLTSVGETFVSTNRNETKTKEKLAKSCNVLGVDRNAIINQVSRSINHVPKVTSVKHQATNSYSFDSQRRVDFKKYLRDQEILKARMEKRQLRSMTENIDLASLARNTSNPFIDDVSEEDDYVEDENYDEECSK
ncbi:uncharacterized protein LOC130685356 [Daphnia carinata]|uniref:uncharacterized protein LOC130685356 n=1 Tax=Daphnia carinata TaxID=120202 RepID=UPI00257F3E57|nr:uncharacterized protein LOC130685356 [Daphnia carinata]